MGNKQDDPVNPNPMDRRLDDLRRQGETEDVNDMNAEAVKPSDVEELDRFGELIRRAFRASGEAPSRAAIDWADKYVDLPADLTSPVADRRFALKLREQMKRTLQQQAGTSTLGGFIQTTRANSALTEAAAAQMAELPLPAYRQLEAGRMPIWRARASAFASFCRQLHIDVSIVLRWAGLELTRGAAFGRLDVTGDDLTNALRDLGHNADSAAVQEFEQWRRAFISSYAAASGGSAPLKQ